MSICKNIRLLLQETAGVARVLNGMAYVYLQADQLERSSECHFEAITYLKQSKANEELAFTHSLISWVLFLQDDFQNAVVEGRRALDIMEQHKIHTLAFRTKPDIHAQLGICYFYDRQLDRALEHSNYCEAHKVDSSATGELLRTLLRGLINDARNESHLADISFNYIPELFSEIAEVDIHIEALFLRIMLNRFAKADEDWNANDIRQQGIDYCKTHNLNHTISWFTSTP